MSKAICDCGLVLCLGYLLLIHPALLASGAFTMKDNIKEIPIDMEVFRTSIKRAIEERSLKEINESNLDLIKFDSEKHGTLMTIELSQRIAGLRDEDIVIFKRWPKTWWDAFKEKWFPSWARDRWPIQWNEINIREKRFKAVCPHLGTHPTNVHLHWVLRMKKESLK